MKKLLLVILIMCLFVFSSCQKQGSEYSRLLDDYFALEDKYDDFETTLDEILLENNKSYKSLYNNHEQVLDDIGRIQDDIFSLYAYFESDGTYGDAHDALKHLLSVLDKYY